MKGYDMTKRQIFKNKDKDMNKVFVCVYIYTNKFKYYIIIS